MTAEDFARDCLARGESGPIMQGETITDEVGRTYRKLSIALAAMRRLNGLGVDHTAEDGERARALVERAAAVA